MHSMACSVVSVPANTLRKQETRQCLNLNVLPVVVENIGHDAETTQSHDLTQCREIFGQLRPGCQSSRNLGIELGLP